MFVDSWASLVLATDTPNYADQSLGQARRTRKPCRSGATKSYRLMGLALEPNLIVKSW